MITILIIAMVIDLRSLDKQFKANEAEIEAMKKEIHGRDC